MTLRIEDYVSRFRNTAVERELAAELRKEPEKERLRFIEELLASGQRHSFGVALLLAKQCLQERESFERILNEGLNRADASVIKFWLEAVIDGLGFRRVLSILSRRLQSDPAAVIKARYWLPTWLPRGNGAARASLQELDQQIEEVVKVKTDLQRLMEPVRGGE